MEATEGWLDGLAGPSRLGSGSVVARSGGLLGSVGPGLMEDELGDELGRRGIGPGGLIETEFGLRRSSSRGQGTVQAVPHRGLIRCPPLPE